MYNENSTQGLISTLSFTSAHCMGSARATQAQKMAFREAETTSLLKTKIPDSFLQCLQTNSQTVL